MFSDLCYSCFMGAALVHVYVNFLHLTLATHLLTSKSDGFLMKSASNMWPPIVRFHKRVIWVIVLVIVWDEEKRPTKASPGSDAILERKRRSWIPQSEKHYCCKHHLENKKDCGGENAKSEVLGLQKGSTLPPQSTDHWVSLLYANITKSVLTITNPKSPS